MFGDKLKIEQIRWSRSSSFAKWQK